MYGYITFIRRGNHPCATPSFPWCKRLRRVNACSQRVLHTCMQDHLSFLYPHWVAAHSVPCHILTSLVKIVLVHMNLLISFTWLYNSNNCITGNSNTILQLMTTALWCCYMPGTVLNQGRQTFPTKGQTVNIWDFAGQTVSVMTTLLFEKSDVTDDCHKQVWLCSNSLLASLMTLDLSY